MRASGLRAGTATGIRPGNTARTPHLAHTPPRQRSAGRMQAQAVTSAEALGLADDVDLEGLKDDAVTWATQHGLVGMAVLVADTSQLCGPYL